MPFRTDSTKRYTSSRHRRRSKNKLHGITFNSRWMSFNSFIITFVLSGLLHRNACTGFTASNVYETVRRCRTLEDCRAGGAISTHRRNISRSYNTRLEQQAGNNDVEVIPRNSVNDAFTERRQTNEISSSSKVMNRRDSIHSLATILTASTLLSTTPLPVSAHESTSRLEDLNLGTGKWSDSCDSCSFDNNKNIDIPASFVTYANRILLNYDIGVKSWWELQLELSSLMSNSQSNDKLRNDFGRLGMSVQLALERYLMEEGANGMLMSERYGDLANLFVEKYANVDSDAMRHIGILFSLLPIRDQPVAILKELSERVQPAKQPPSQSSDSVLPISFATEELRSLLPEPYTFAYQNSTDAFLVTPPVNTSPSENSEIEPIALTSAKPTPFGPLADTPLKRERPNYTPDIYGLLAISGGIGCALTHTVVIPLDVVKTRLQTDPTAATATATSSNSNTNLIDYAVRMIKIEGPGSLFLGTQATIVGYLWYGLSVYPTYAFCKRFLGNALLPPAVAAVHINDVALVAGAISSVVASLGLTPMEACRIRTVAEPRTYKRLGLLGTARVIASEESSSGSGGGGGWRSLYAGFPSLVTRQVIFGSVKFLAFERSAEFLMASLPPNLREMTSVSLMISFVAGGIAGTLSSVVSHPADSVLTYVAKASQDNEKMGVIEGCRVMIQKDGVESLWKGLGSRCVWAGSIIAGQFLLYDIFRTLFGVNGEDLSQVFEVVINNG